MAETRNSFAKRETNLPVAGPEYAVEARNLEDGTAKGRNQRRHHDNFRTTNTRSRSTSSRSATSQRLETLGSVSRNTSISASSTIHPLVFTVSWPNFQVHSTNSGMDFYVVMGRAGLKVASKKAKAGRVGFPHRVTREETQNWFKKTFDGLILNKA
jgi:hypothetical protein